MAVSGDLRIFATVGSYPFKHHHHQTLGKSFSPSKVGFKGLNGGLPTSKGPYTDLKDHKLTCNYHQSFGIFGDNTEVVSPEPAIQETESLLLNAVNMNFLERLNLAWKILFPSPSTKRNSNAKIAKQRLKMILFADRCAVSDEAKQKIVSNIVGALSDFVEIDSQDKVQLSVSTNTDLGTVYSVTVPVRRVKPAYQDVDEFGAVTNVEYKDTGEGSDSVDVRFDFLVPDENSRY